MRYLKAPDTVLSTSTAKKLNDTVNRVKSVINQTEAFGMEVEQSSPDSLITIIKTELNKIGIEFTANKLSEFGQLSLDPIHHKDFNSITSVCNTFMQKVIMVKVKRVISQDKLPRFIDTCIGFMGYFDYSIAKILSAPTKEAQIEQFEKIQVVFYKVYAHLAIPKDVVTAWLESTKCLVPDYRVAEPKPQKISLMPPSRIKLAQLKNPKKIPKKVAPQQSSRQIITQPVPSQHEIVTHSSKSIFETNYWIAKLDESKHVLVSEAKTKALKLHPEELHIDGLGSVEHARLNKLFYRHSLLVNQGGEGSFSLGYTLDDLQTSEQIEEYSNKLDAYINVLDWALIKHFDKATEHIVHLKSGSMRVVSTFLASDLGLDANNHSHMEESGNLIPGINYLTYVLAIETTPTMKAKIISIHPRKFLPSEFNLIRAK